MKRSALILLVLLAAIVNAGDKAPYRLEVVTTPPDVVLEAGGMGFWPDGTLVICTRRGEIWTLTDGKWKRFATGLHEPLGLHASKQGQVYVVQRPELTRITDADGDGVAEKFETICDTWGNTGDYHEFCYGPVVDKDGNFCGTLNLANRGDPIGKCEMGSPTPYRGWSFKVTPQGEFIPWSSGLRSPNGIGIDPEGEIFCTDNQGGWVGTSFMHHLSKGAFHGHPSSLVWDKSLQSLDKMTVDDFDKLRKRPVVCFPQGVIANSPTEPRWDSSGGKFGPFAGQCFCGDNARPILMRIALENIDGEYQGACFPFWEGRDIGNGLNRLAWAPDGSLYIGYTGRGWGTAEGLKRMVWTGEVPMEIHTMSLTDNGFELTFTKPVDPVAASNPDTYSLQHYYFLYHAIYGSPQTEQTPVKVKEVRLSDDKRKVSLILPELVRQRIYELRLRGIKAADGMPLGNELAVYTLNRLKK